MRRFLTAGLLLLVVSAAGAQIGYRPPASTGTGFTTPGAGVIVDIDGAGDLEARTLTAGTGVSVTNGAGAAGNPTVAVDTATTPQFSSGTGSASATGSIGTWYHETDSGLVSTYSATDTLATVMTTQTHFIDEDSFATDSATKAPSQQSVKAYVASNGRIDPSTSVDIVEEFLAGTDTAGTVGTHGLYFANLSSGTGAGLASSPMNHPGIWRMNSHATNDNSGNMMTMAGSNNSSVAGWDATVDWFYDALVLLGSNSTAITNTALYVQLGQTYNVVENQPAAIRIRYDTDLSDTTFIFQMCIATGAAGCQAAGDDTNSKTVASTITPVGGTWYRFRIRRAASGVGGNETYYFRVNDETEKTFCSSGCDDTILESNGIKVPQVAYLTRTTSGVLSSDLDYIRIGFNGASRY